MLEVYEKKYNKHIAEKIANLPDQDIIVLRASVNLFTDLGEEKRISYKQLFDEIE